MAKIRVTKFFAGVRDGEHQARAFLPGVCYELADDGAEPPAGLPGSLLAVALTEGWAGITAKGTPAEPELLAAAPPAVQRMMVDADLAAKKVAELEAADEAAEAAAKAKALTEAAEKKAAEDVEVKAATEAAKRTAELKAIEAAKQKAANPAG